MQTAFVDGGFGAGHGDAVIGDEDEECVVPVVGIFQQFDQPPHALIDAGDGLVILGDFGAAGRSVRQESGDDYVCGVVNDFFDAGVAICAGGRVAEAVRLVGEFFGNLTVSMRVGRADVKEEGLVALLGQYFFAVVGHHDRAAGGAGDGLVEMVDRFGGDVVLAAAGGSIAGFAQQDR